MHKSNAGYEYWDSIKDEVVDKYINQGRSTNSIAEDYGCYGTTVGMHLKRWRIPIRTQRYNNTYSVNTHFFDTIDSEEKAYIVGLLLSDGHISKNNKIMLTLKDLDLIEKYRAAMGSNHRVSKDRYGNYAMTFTSIEISNKLREMGFHNRKSYHIDINRILEHIPPELEHHFVRGLFDGDGSIRIYRYDYLNKPQLHFGFTGLDSVVQYVKDFLGIKTKTVVESELTRTCVSSCRKTICSIFNILYKDATIYMDRKWNTFNEIINM